jgi:hypothetical protein
MTMRYDRKLSDDCCDWLGPSGPLSFLLSDFRLWALEDRFALDVQFRPGNELKYYHGTTALLTVRLNPRTPVMALSADKAYSDAKGYARVCRTWSLADAAELESLLPAYFQSGVELAKDRYYRNRKEGFWQNRLALAFGPEWNRDREWLILDREAVIGFPSDAERAAIQNPICQTYLAVREHLQGEDPKAFGQPDSKSLGNEVDFLGLGRRGELLCIELKHGSNASGIYWGPLQVAVYRDIFKRAIGEAADDIHQLLLQKIRLGLLPREAEERWPAGGPSEVVPILAVAMPNDASECWRLLDRVMRERPDLRVQVVKLRDQTPL